MKTYWIYIVTSLMLVIHNHTIQAQFVPEGERGQKESPVPTQDTLQKEKKERPKKQKKQKKNNGPPSAFWENLTFGGNLGGGFGNPNFIDLSPTIGYKVSDKLELGLGPNYAFYRFKNDPTRADDHLYGGRAYGQWKLYKALFLRGEVESIRATLSDSLLKEPPPNREWQIVPLAGAGLEFKLFNLVNFQFTLLYNPLHKDGRSWRGTPWVTRFGFGF